MQDSVNSLSSPLKNQAHIKGFGDCLGGAIEFGETPEEQLKRELLEETTALAAAQREL